MIGRSLIADKGLLRDAPPTSAPLARYSLVCAIDQQRPCRGSWTPCSIVALPQPQISAPVIWLWAVRGLRDACHPGLDRRLRGHAAVGPDGRVGRLDAEAEVRGTTGVRRIGMTEFHVTPADAAAMGGVKGRIEREART